MYTLYVCTNSQLLNDPKTLHIKPCFQFLLGIFFFLGGGGGRVGMGQTKCIVGNLGERYGVPSVIAKKLLRLLAENRIEVAQGRCEVPVVL